MKKLLIGFIFFFVFPVSSMYAPMFPVDQLNAAEHLRRIARHHNLASLLIDDAYTKQAKGIVFAQVKECALQISREPNSVEQPYVDQLLKALSLQGAQVRVVDVQSITGKCRNITGLLENPQQLHEKFKETVRFCYSHVSDMAFVGESNKIIQDVCKKSQAWRELIAGVCIRNDVIDQLPFIYSVFHGDRTNNSFIGEKRRGEQCLATKPIIQLTRAIFAQEDIRNFFFDFWLRLSAFDNEIFLAAILTVNATNDASKNIDSITSFLKELFPKTDQLKTEECPIVRDIAAKSTLYHRLLLKSLDLWNEWRVIAQYNEEKQQKSEELICVCNEILRRTTSLLLEKCNVEKLFDIVGAISKFRSITCDYSMALCMNISDFSERMRTRFKNNNKLKVIKYKRTTYSPHLQKICINDTKPINLYHNFGVYIDVLYFNSAFRFFTKTLEKVAPHLCGNDKDGQICVGDDRQFYQTYGLRLIEYRNTQILLINKMSDFALVLEQKTQMPRDSFHFLPSFGLAEYSVPIYGILSKMYGATMEDSTRKPASTN